MTTCATCGVAIVGALDPSPAEMRVLNAIVAFHEEYGRFPTYREIRIAISYRSTQAVYSKVHGLAAKGWLTLSGRQRARDPGREEARVTATLAPELLQERATELLNLIRRSSFRATVPNLCTAAIKEWPELGKRGAEKELDELANAAFQMNNGAGATSAADWPVRTVARRQPADPSAPEAAPRPPAAPEAPLRAPAPAASLKAEHTNGAAPKGTPKTELILQALRRLLPLRHGATADELYQMLVDQGVEVCALTSFRTIHLPRVRRELGISWSQAAQVGRRGGWASKAASSPEPDPVPAAPAAGAETVTGSITQEPSPLKAEEVVSAAPPGGLVEINGGDDRFRAVRRDDGDWDVELTIRVDRGTMDQLAAVVWDKVVMPRGGA